jgi:hypothetical protein
VPAPDSADLLPGDYRIVVRGRITDRLAASFDGMAVEPGATTTALTGRLRDQAHLMGVIHAIEGLGLELVSANTFEPTDQNASQQKECR